MIKKMKKKFNLVLSLMFLFLTTLQAQEQINVNDLRSELYKLKQSNGYDIHLMYFPTEYWAIGAANNPNTSKDVIEMLQYIFNDYVIVLGGRFEMNANNSNVFKPTKEKELYKNIYLVDQNGKTYKPLKKDELTREAADLSEAMRPLFSSMLGQFGDGLEMFFFKVQDQSGNNIIDAKQRTPFTINFFGNEFKYDLPLSAFVPKKTCPVDSEKHNGKWNYCPIHGEKLEE